MTTIQTTLQQDLGSLAADLVSAGNHEGAALVTSAVNALAAPQQAVAASSESVECWVCNGAGVEFDDFNNKRPCCNCGDEQASTNQPVQAKALTDKDMPPLPEAWGWARNVDGRIEISLGSQKPFCNERGSGYFTPWAPMFGGDQMQEYARGALLASQPSAQADVAAVRDAAIDEIADIVEGWADKSGDKAEYEQREMLCCEDSEMKCLYHASEHIRALKSAAPTAQPKADAMAVLVGCGKCGGKGSTGKDGWGRDRCTDCNGCGKVRHD